MLSDQLAKGSWMMPGLSCTSPLTHRLFSLNTCYKTAWSMVGWIHSGGISDKEGQLWNYIQIFDCIEALLLLFSCSVMSDSLWSHGLQHASLPHPSPFPGACSNSCPLSRWCCPNILSSVIPFSFYPQCFPATGSFPVSQFFTSGGPKYWSFSFSISHSNEDSPLEIGSH